ncbi:MAG: thioesterase family protein [Candidatus Omnitrophica bacterium]|jgi:acyl-CoA thioester hydrolase|nr:thioesterase family protein [Candidatus Omnitrophota bacterium]MDD5078246.1 thioesterase family protein [Candidatus Omnitrophota bacterium]MDD5725093.1 thioesterase family protein [Candidatus Omnitrophota bacterium]
MKQRIYYHHTDCGGVVYYANYLDFLEEARTEYFAQKGSSIKQLSDSGVMFVVMRQEIDYKYPAVYADDLDIKTSVGEMTGVRIEFLHEIYNQDSRLIVKARTVLVCVDRSLKPQAIPEELRKKLL